MPRAIQRLGREVYTEVVAELRRFETSAPGVGRAGAGGDLGHERLASNPHIPSRGRDDENIHIGSGVAKTSYTLV